jgi:hypothetical protein
MLIPGGFLSGTVLSWLLVAPAIPLCILLVKRPVFNSLSISLILLCVVSFLTSSFSLVVPSDTPVNSSFQEFSVFIEFFFNILVLKSCVRDKTHQYLIVTAGLIYCGIFLSLMVITNGQEYPFLWIRIGYVLLFALALSAIINQFQDVSHHLTGIPAFWITAGIFFQYGLVSLLLLVNDSSTQKIAEDSELGILYMIINVIRFLFFSIGLLLFEKNSKE